MLAVDFIHETSRYLHWKSGPLLHSGYSRSCLHQTPRNMVVFSIGLRAPKRGAHKMIGAGIAT